MDCDDSGRYVACHPCNFWSCLRFTFENCSSKNAACACHAGSRVSGASAEFSDTGIPARKRATSFGPVFTGIARGATCGFSCAESVSALTRARTIDKAVQFVFMASDHGVFARRNRAADPTAPLPNRPAIPQCANAIDKTSSKSSLWKKQQEEWDKAKPGMVAQFRGA